MDLLSSLLFVLAAAAAVFALLAWRRPIAAPDLTPVMLRLEAIERLVRDEALRLRDGMAAEARASREELATNVTALRTDLVRELGAARATSDEADRAAREELGAGLAFLRTDVVRELSSTREILSGALDRIQQSNEAKLEQMRQTVDEKLQGTLEKRLGESFQLVSERLEQVHRGLGEMQSLATGVGDLKKVLTNVKVRGSWGEVQLGGLLEQMLAPEQYGRNVAVTGKGERVEFALRIPNENDETVWLPIDAKFPLEDYDRVVAAAEAGDAAALEDAACQLEKRLKQCAKEIAAKYVAPPLTMDFAVMFLPNEGLYAEVLRRPGFADSLLRDFKVHVTGPTTLCALLQSLRYSFQRVAMHRKSAEVWKVLGAAKTEFNKYSLLLDKVSKKLEEASNTVDDARRKTTTIQRKLRDVEGTEEPLYLEATGSGQI